MIGRFPTPYNDELIYSILSRYHIISSNESEHLTSNELFDRDMKLIKMDLFPYAKKLEMKLQHFNFYNSIEIIENFSFFNYYNKFLSTDTKNKFRNLMLKERPGRIINEIYNIDIGKYNSEYYKFCLSCLEEDSNNGVPHWKISHNLPGMTVCVKHKCKLIMSEVLFNGKKLVPLSSEVQGKPLPILSAKEEEILSLVNEQTFYLFSTDQTFTEYITPYISFLYTLGYFNNFSINKNKLKEDFNDFYSPNICAILGIDKEFVIKNIIECIKYSTYNIHPLFHILFIIFCGKKIEDLNNNSLPIPFNYEPLNCIVCKTSEKDNIHKLVLRYSSEETVGRFWCACGYNYVITSRDQNKIETIDYGEALYKHIMDLLFREELSISDICNQLHISKLELERYLISHRK